MLPSRGEHGVRLVLVVLAVAVLGCSARDAAPISVTVTLGDGSVETATLLPGVGTPALTEAQARAEAARYLNGLQQATSVAARYVRLTLPNQMAVADHRSIYERTVWLVSYAGVGFSGPSQCECATISAQPNTLVALDATSGKLVASFGTPSDLWRDLQTTTSAS
jgi:hypothetical protein